MSELAIAIVILIAVAGPAIGWAVRKDRRRRQAGGPIDKGEVA